MSHDAVTRGFARQQGASQRPVIHRDDQFRPSLSIYGGHWLDRRSCGYVAARSNILEVVNKGCAQMKRAASNQGSRAREALPGDSGEKGPLSITRRRKR